MVSNSNSSDRLLTIYLALGQYPILSNKIRARMRQFMIDQGVIQAHSFETQVREIANQSQEREGIYDPFTEEDSDVWEMRMQRVRDQLTDVLFSQRLPIEEFERIILTLLSERGIPEQDYLLSFNPELAPQEIVFEQALMFEKLDPQKRSQYEARMQETKVVLIRNLISDQLQYVNVAKEWFTLGDLLDIRKRKIGAGKIGGKAAGMLLAHRILTDTEEFELKPCMREPESFFIGSNEFYTYMTINDLTHWNDQKYKTEEAMRTEYPQIIQEFQAGEFPADILDRLKVILEKEKNNPLIVRSSSLLEDNFGTSFAGKYDSIFLPNQGAADENLKALTQAIATIYASTLNPNALLYRRARGLQDYDERMAILIQDVQGQRFGRYYFPHGAGVAFSRNTYRWSSSIRVEDGFVRLVWGLGTRAVDRVGNDYPRVIALSHPLLRPSTNPKLVRRYSQQYIDLIDLKDNEFKTVPIYDVLNENYRPLRYVAQLDQGGDIQPIRSRIIDGDVSSLIVTFDELLKRTDFANTMRGLLTALEHAYKIPVDVEFTLNIDEASVGKPDICITVVQCRPQAQLMRSSEVRIPTNIPKKDIIFDTHFVVPHGEIDQITYVIYIPHQAYFSLATNNDRFLLASQIGKLNKALSGKRFFCVGPGRWGSSNADLGVPINYGDIYNASALVELTGEQFGIPPEPSLGTHFFQDLMESQIYPLAIPMDEEQNWLNNEFFEQTPNRVNDFIHLEPQLKDCLRLIQVSDFRPKHNIRILMNDEQSRAIAYLVPASVK